MEAFKGEQEEYNFSNDVSGGNEEEMQSRQE